MLTDLIKPFISDEANMAFLQTHVEGTKAYFKRTKAKDLMPMLMLKTLKPDLSGTEDILMVLTDFPSDPEVKFPMLNQIGKKIAGEGFFVLSALFVSEAWMAMAVEGENSVLRPSERSDKAEVIVISVYSMDNKQVGEIFRMKRNKKQEISLGESVMQDREGTTIQSNILAEFFSGYVAGMRLKGMN